MKSALAFKNVGDFRGYCKKIAYFLKILFISQANHFVVNRYLTHQCLQINWSANRIIQGWQHSTLRKLYTKADLEKIYFVLH